MFGKFGRLPAAGWSVVAVLVLGVAVGFGVLQAAPSSSSGPAPLVGTRLSGSLAPDFRLMDQFGRPTTLAQFRHRVVILTFLGTDCSPWCQLHAQDVRRALSILRPLRRQVSALAVSIQPETDRAGRVRAFSRSVGLLRGWRFLIGSRKELAPVWKSYFVFAAPASASAAVGAQDSLVTYIIDPSGRERALLATDLTAGVLVRDVRILLGVGPRRGSLAEPGPSPGHPAPAISLASLPGRALSLASLRGKVVLVNFWATWCPACKREMPELERWYKRFRARGFVVLGVDEQEGRRDVSQFVRELGVTYPIVLDTTGNQAVAYHVVGIPASFLVDRQGIIRSVRFGVLPPDFMRRDAAPVLGMGAT